MQDKDSSTFAKEVLKLLGIKIPNKQQVEIINMIVENLVVKTPVTFDSRLTTREKLCLYWSAKGKSSVETAQLLKVKKSTIDCYKKRILQKLSCANMTQAVYEGIRLGILFSYL